MATTTTRTRHWIDAPRINPSELCSPRVMLTEAEKAEIHAFHAAVAAAQTCRATGNHTPYVDHNYGEIFCRTCEDYLGAAE